MMNRWGLNGMESFEQANVARKEGSRLDQVDKAQLGDSMP
jgi:biotin synthase